MKTNLTLLSPGLANEHNMDLTSPTSPILLRSPRFETSALLNLPVPQYDNHRSKRHALDMSSNTSESELGILNLTNVTPLQYITQKIQQEDIEDSFLVGDLGEVYRMYKLWKQQLSKVTPFYAVKSNPDPMLLKLMIELGMSFDCASKREMQIILQYSINPNRIIYANPCKQISHLKYAKLKGVKKITFDNLDELMKIHKHYKEAELFLRILPMDCHSKVPFGSKFGAEIETSLMLINKIKELKLNLVGLSFHVGSDCLNPDGYMETLKRAKIVYDYSKSLNLNLTTIDIGGGFPGAKNKKEFFDICSKINESLERYFNDPNLNFIAEPGRFFAASFYTLATTVIGKRVCLEFNQKNIMYYLNDGVFKSFSEGAFIPSIIYEPEILKTQNICLPIYNQNEGEYCTLWGPALGAKDKINTMPHLRLPELQLSDWLYFENMGAYSTCFNMEFNGFEQPPIFYVNTEIEELFKLLY